MTKDTLGTMIIITMLITLAFIITILYGSVIIQYGDAIIHEVDNMIAQIKGVAPDWATYHIIIKVDDTITFNEFCEHRVYALGSVICSQPQGIITYRIPDGAHVIDKKGVK